MVTRVNSFITVLADSCHGVGFALSKALMAKKSTWLAAATPSNDCLTQFKNAFWDGDRIVSQRVNLADEAEINGFLAKAEFSLDSACGIGSVIANVGSTPSRWQQFEHKPFPKVHETSAAEWLRFGKDVAGVGILLKTTIPRMISSPPLDGRKVIAILGHVSSPRHCRNACAFLAADAALDAMVDSLSCELTATSALAAEFVTVKIDAPMLGTEKQIDLWCAVLVEQLSKLRHDDNFAQEHNGRTLEIPNFPSAKSIDTAWYGSEVS